MNPDNFELNNEQWGFMYQHYPEYCQAPYQMLTWLHGQSKAHEEMYLKKPSVGGTATGGNDDGKDEEFVLESGGLDGNTKKVKSKKDDKEAARLAEEAKKKKVEEIKRKKELEGRSTDPSQIEIKP